MVLWGLCARLLPERKQWLTGDNKTAGSEFIWPRNNYSSLSRLATKKQKSIIYFMTTKSFLKYTQQFVLSTHFNRFTSAVTISSFLRFEVAPSATPCLRGFRYRASMSLMQGSTLASHRIPWEKRLHQHSSPCWERVSVLCSTVANIVLFFSFNWTVNSLFYKLLYILTQTFLLSSIL